MSNTKVTQEELAQLQSIKQSYDQLTYELGRITLQLETLTSERENILNRISQVRELDNNIIQSITQKYGKGSIDIDTGEFTATK